MSSELAAAYNTVVSNAFILPKINSFFFALFDVISQFFCSIFNLCFAFLFLVVACTSCYRLFVNLYIARISVISILDWDIVKIL